MFSKEKLRYRLYRLQQRLAITQRELLALWVTFSLLALGLVVKEYRKRTLRFDPAMYVESDSLFEAAFSELRRESDSTLALAESLATVDTVEEAPPRLIVNINTATSQELEQLPRIGPAMAQRIIDYRERYGPFRQKKDLIRVRGIGPKTFERLEPLVVVR